jgi:hypothetical protein
MVLIETASSFLPETAPRDKAVFDSVSTLGACSNSVFHSPQFSQRPAHFTKLAPQF